MYFLNGLCFLLVIIHQLLCFVRGHGRMIDPAARNYAWRLPEFRGIYPAYYNDNALYCGGFQKQWDVHGGRCGVCGDEYGKSPLFVSPGTYAKNIITKTYRQGQQIQVKVEITANHKGWFEFRLGDIGTPPITQAKLTHLLQLVSGGTRWQLPDQNTRVYTIDLQLPPDLTCTQCVLQWWYNAGNSWGCDPNEPDKCGIGLGRQETFINCADIAIVSSTDPMTGIPTQGTTDQTTATPVASTSSQTTSEPTSSTSAVSSTTSGPAQTTPTETSTERTTTSSNPTTKPLTEEPTVGPCNGLYVPVYGFYPENVDMDTWCHTNCVNYNGNCPARLCQCQPYYY